MATPTLKEVERGSGQAPEALNLCGFWGTSHSHTQGLVLGIVSLRLPGLYSGGLSDPRKTSLAMTPPRV